MAPAATLSPVRLSTGRTRFPVEEHMTYAFAEKKRIRKASKFARPGPAGAPPAPNPACLLQRVFAGDGRQDAGSKNVYKRVRIHVDLPDRESQRDSQRLEYVHYTLARRRSMSSGASSVV